MTPPTILVTILNELNHKKDQTWKHLTLKKEEPFFLTTTLPITAGVTAFSSSLALSTYMQLKVLGISTGTVRPIPTLLGITSVGVAAIASHTVASKCHTYFNIRQTQGNGYSSYDDITTGEILSNIKERFNEEINNNNNNNNKFNSTTSSHKSYIRICVLGLLSYKLLGGRFWSISPSSYTHLGSFAKASIPAPSTGYATNKERQIIESLGRKYGCHTCGTKGGIQKKFFFTGQTPPVLFHADHMPPNALVKQHQKERERRIIYRIVSKLFPFISFSFSSQPIKQRFYPQCVDCSNKQGKILSKGMQSIHNNNIRKTSLSSSSFKYLKRTGGGKNAHFHGTRFRFAHLAGGVIGGVSVYGATEDKKKKQKKSNYFSSSSNKREEIQDYNYMAGYESIEEFALRAIYRIKKEFVG